ncbi:MAG: hypothetical protein K2X87_02415, partial [Gemmataceae bacterium]|nr:hypothetical protein [Gemmataceae bacterium]
VGGAPAALFAGQVPPKPAPAAELPIDPAVLALIADLGAADYRTREKAGKALEARGEKVLPALRRAAAEADSPEVGRRLAVLVRRLEYDRIVAPKRVTLSVKNKPAKDVFDEVARQTGYKIDFQPVGGRGDGRYSFDLDNVPFWVAMDKLTEATGMGVQNNYDDDALQVNGYNGVGSSPYVCYAGPFKFVAQNISLTKNLPLANLGPAGGARQQEQAYLQFSIQSEPKNPILQPLQAELISATDDTGASLVPPRDPNQNQHFSRSYYGGPGYRTFNFSSNLNFVRGGRDATRIKSLKGRIGLVLLAGTVPEVVVTDPLKTKAKKFAGRTAEVDFDTFAEANGGYSLTMTVRKTAADDPNNPDYNWLNSAWQRVEVTDAAGGKYRGYVNNTNYNGTSVTFTMQFQAQDRQGRAQKLGPPARVVFNEWLQVTHEVPFEFKDLPLQ